MDHADRTDDRSEAPLDDDLRREPRHVDDAVREPHREDDDRLTTDSRSVGSHAGVDVDRRWQATQARFLESPREAVAAADELVNDVIDDVRRRLDTQRAQVADTWQRDDADTEDLRTAMLRYREVLDGLTRTG